MCRKSCPMRTLFTVGEYMKLVYKVEVFDNNDQGFSGRRFSVLSDCVYEI